MSTEDLQSIVDASPQPCEGSAWLKPMPTSRQWREALLHAGAVDALEGSRLAELAANEKYPSAAQ